MAIIALFPELLSDSEINHAFIEYHLPQELDNFRTLLLSEAHHADNINVGTLSILELKNTIHRNVSELKTPLVNFNFLSSSIQTLDDAKSYAQRLIKLISLEDLSKEIQIATQEVIHSNNSKDFERLSKLQALQENLKSELGIIQ